MVPPLAGSTAQMSAQFLNSVLSQRGPSALPYTEDVKWLIRQHLVSLIQEFPGLQAKTAIFAHNDGRTVNLLQAEGTIPMYYQEVLYNIPAVIWLMETYPRQAPLVYVTPTRDMIIKRGHPHVNPSGMVSISYLQGWIFPSSNLVDLVRNLSHLFGRDPPLYAKQSSVHHRHHHTDHISSSHSTSSSSSATGTTTTTTTTTSNTPSNARPALARPPILPPSPQRPLQMDDPAEVFKRNAINKLLEMLHTDTTTLRKATEVETDGLFNTQAVLRQREEQLAKCLRKMLDEKEGLEQQLQTILTNTDVLEAWLRENDGKSKTTDLGTIDDVFEPCDALSTQMLECTAADLAIEDVIYSLEKAVQEGAIPFDAYIKNVRSLSREQFFNRATSAKVRSAQMQAQVAGMASRASHYVT